MRPDQRPATIEVTQRSGVPLRWVIAIAAIFLAGVGAATAIVVPKLVAHQTGGAPQPTATGGPTRPAEPSTVETTGPAESGRPHESHSPPEDGDSAGSGPVVAVAPGLTDGRADDVVAMFGVYFHGINAKDYRAVGTVLDPKGTTDPNDKGDMRELADGTRSTTDSHITLTSLDDVGDGLLSAEVTFRSDQRAGDGPKNRPAETCTRWDVVYTLSHHRAYRIRKSAATSRPC